MGKVEALVEMYLVQEIKKLGGECYKFTSPTRRGVPDRLCLLPMGFHCFVECKSIDGTLSKLQQFTCRRLHDLKQPVFIISSKDGVDKLITMLIRSITNAIADDKRAEEHTRDHSQEDVFIAAPGTEDVAKICNASVSKLQDK